MAKLSKETQPLTESMVLENPFLQRKLGDKVTLEPSTETKFSHENREMVKTRYFLKLLEMVNQQVE